MRLIFMLHMIDISVDTPHMPLTPFHFNWLHREGLTDANRKAAKAALNVLAAIAIKEDEALNSKVCVRYLLECCWLARLIGSSHGNETCKKCTFCRKWRVVHFTNRAIQGHLIP